jgi:hypothetical protein
MRRGAKIDLKALRRRRVFDDPVLNRRSDTVIERELPGIQVARELAGVVLGASERQA